jgi:hypothetical protein
MDSVTLTGLLKIEMRSGPTLRFCDGGLVTWGAETFAAKDDVFGAIGSLDALEEGVGDEVPALRLTFLPASTAAAAALVQPGWQGSPVRFWIAEVNPASGAVVGTPDLMFHGQIDTGDLIVDRGSRAVEYDIVSTAERLFALNEGNSLNPRFHKRVWPGETGEDNATGLGSTVAWGTASPAGTAVAGSVTGGGGGGGFGSAILGGAVAAFL